MALEELIPLEKIICVTLKTKLKATYTIINMKLTTLFDEVVTEVEKGILAILEIRILLHTIKNVAFSNEIEGNKILFELNECMNHQLYTYDSQWSCSAILDKLKALYKLIVHNIIINGSLIWHMNEKIEWDLYPLIYSPL